MKFATFIVLAILALCSLLAAGHSARDTEYKCKEYSDSSCSKLDKEREVEEGKCFIPAYGKYVKVAGKSGNNVIVTQHAGCSTGPIKTVTFKKDTCHSDPITGKYVKWSW